MQEERTVGQIMEDHIRTIHPKEAIDSALRRLLDEGSRSVIVTDRGVPVGLFDAVAVRECDPLEADQVEDVMLRDIPSLTEEMTIGEASDRTVAAGADRLPVVDRDGFLIGELTREDLVAETRPELDSGDMPAQKQEPKQEPKVIDANDPTSVLSEAEPGMVAVTTDGVKVGVVVDVHIGDEEHTWLLVEHGMLNKKRTIVDGDLVDLVDGDAIILSIDQQTFKGLRAQ